MSDESFVVELRDNMCDLARQLLAVIDNLNRRKEELAASYAVRDVSREATVVAANLLLEEAAGADTVADVLRLDSWGVLCRCEDVPHQLVRDRAAPSTHLLRFVAALPQRARKRALAEASELADRSEAMSDLRSAAQRERLGLVSTHRHLLACSDHQPVHVQLQLKSTAGAPLPERLSLMTHNVLERCRDGLSTYVSSLCQAAYSDRGRRRLMAQILTEDMLAADVVKASQERVVRLLESQLDSAIPSAADTPAELRVAFLQEVSAPMADFLQFVSANREPPWYWSFSAGWERPPQGDSCAANTAIVSTQRLDNIADLCVEFDRPEGARRGGRVRRYAAATYKQSLILVSVHVLHEPIGTRGGPHNGAVSEAALRSRFDGLLRQGYVVVAAGDYNCKVELGAARINEELAVVRVQPDAPTQLRMNGESDAVDGVMVYFDDNQVSVQVTEVHVRPFAT